MVCWNVFKVSFLSVRCIMWWGKGECIGYLSMVCVDVVGGFVDK